MRSTVPWSGSGVASAISRKMACCGSYTASASPSLARASSQVAGTHQGVQGERGCGECQVPRQDHRGLWYDQEDHAGMGGTGAKKTAMRVFRVPASTCAPGSGAESLWM